MSRKHKARPQQGWSSVKFGYICCSIISISRIKAQIPQLMLDTIISFLCTPSPPRCSSKTAPKSFFLNDFHLDKMQEAQRLQ